MCVYACVCEGKGIKNKNVFNPILLGIRHEKYSERNQRESSHNDESERQLLLQILTMKRKLNCAETEDHMNLLKIVLKVINYCTSIFQTELEKSRQWQHPEYCPCRCKPEIDERNT